jgi:hypothetical protein
MCDPILLGIAILSRYARYGHGFTLEEIAAFCDCTPQNIQRIEYEAIKKFRRRFRAYLDHGVAPEPAQPSALAPGEILLKQWFTEEAVRAGKSRSAIINRYYRGQYPGLKVRRINHRLICVNP